MLICDTGPLYAAMNRKDQDHARWLDLLETHPGPLILPSPVPAEVCWLLESRIGPAAEADFLQSIVDGELTMEPLTTADVARMKALVVKYANFPLGAVDAAVIVVAERLDVQEIATIDHRHFEAVRDSHGGHFTLLP
ncbi:type II toxin-antitoxin system VapC family toxin [Streptosporangium sp. CA-135522]|uniref:type II toxin-antitoxin system VapC family toxin n=1 Tax=Streptosporangium sp. CA-135522 TaxID=3240072 RepID=UPI003D8DF7D5